MMFLAEIVGLLVIYTCTVSLLLTLLYFILEWLIFKYLDLYKCKGYFITYVMNKEEINKIIKEEKM